MTTGLRWCFIHLTSAMFAANAPLHVGWSVGKASKGHLSHLGQAATCKLHGDSMYLRDDKLSYIILKSCHTNFSIPKKAAAR